MLEFPEQPLEPLAESNALFCPRCGKAFDLGDYYCPRCGYSRATLLARKDRAAATPPPPPIDAPLPDGDADPSNDLIDMTVPATPVQGEAIRPPFASRYRAEELRRIQAKDQKWGTSLRHSPGPWRWSWPHFWRNFFIMAALVNFLGGCLASGDGGGDAVGTIVVFIGLGLMCGMLGRWIHVSAIRRDPSRR